MKAAALALALASTLFAGIYATAAAVNARECFSRSGGVWTVINACTVDGAPEKLAPARRLQPGCR